MDTTSSLQSSALRRQGSMNPMSPNERKFMHDIIELRTELAQLRQESDISKKLFQTVQLDQQALRMEMDATRRSLEVIQQDRDTTDSSRAKGGDVSKRDALDIANAAEAAAGQSASDWHLAFQRLELRMNVLKSDFISRLAESDSAVTIQNFNSSTQQQIMQEVSDLRHSFNLQDQRFSSSLRKILDSVEETIATVSVLRDTIDKLKVEETVAAVSDLHDNGKASSSPFPTTVPHSEMDRRIQRLEEELELMREADQTEDPLEGQQVTSADLDVEKHAYIVQSSIWDCVIVIGGDSIGVSVHALLLFGYLVNMLIQVFFCIIVWANLTDKSISSRRVEAVKHWRGVVGHSVSGMDPVSKNTLVSKICSQDMATSLSATQFGYFGDIAAFLTPQKKVAPDCFNGRFLCNMALTIWLMTILTDLIDNLKFIIAVTSIPRGVSNVIHKQNQVKIISITMCQYIRIFSLSFLPRVLVAVFLGYMGTTFLANTVAVDELLLNTIALAFILECDELVFEAVAPRRAKTLIESLAPIDMSEMRRKYSSMNVGGFNLFAGGGGPGVALRILAVAAFIFLYDHFVLAEYESQMKEARRWLCGGRKDFTFAENKANGVVIYTVTQPHDWNYNENNVKKTVLNLTGLLESSGDAKVDTSSNWWRKYTGMAVYSTSMAEVQTIEADAVSTSALYPRCNDHLSMLGEKLSLQSLLPKVFELSEVTCQQADADMCLMREANHIRGLCPILCGCHDPWSGNFFGVSNRGCPTRCEIDYAASLTSLSSVPSAIKPYLELCIDPPASVLSTLPSWRKFVTGIVSLVSQQIGGQVDFERLVSSGCNFLERVSSGWDLCLGDKTMGRSGRNWCPSTCNCQEDMDGCPGRRCGCWTNRTNHSDIVCPK